MQDLLMTLLSTLTAGGGAAAYAKWQANINKDNIRDLRRADTELDKKIVTLDEKVDTLGMLMAREYVTEGRLESLKDDFHKSLSEVREILIRMEQRQDAHMGRIFEKLDKKADKT